VIQLPEIGPLLTDRPLLALPLAYVGGVLFSFAPCIYPMIPITASIVGGQTVGAERPSKRRAVALTFAYVLGVALFYAALGVIAGMTGTMFGTVSTNPWLHFGIANLLILAALAMLDVIPVRLPASLMARAASAGDGGRIAGAFVMGAASGLVAAPCGAPVMATVLTWVSLTKSAMLGFLYLFVFSLGMCTLLIAVGISVGVLGVLPGAGGWMIWVKRLFALIMLIMAEYYLVRMGGLLI
jgi:thiol:disulfide interchange protein DsbD